MRVIDGNKLLQMNEALAAFLMDGKIEEADKLDAEMIQYCGTDGRVVINRVIAPPKPMYMYAFNRAMLQLRHAYVEEAVLSMIDVMETLHFGGVPEDIYLVFDVLAERRGSRDRFRQPFELACDHLMMATLCIWRFPSISLSFYWKAKTIFKQRGLQYLEEFTDTFIKTQYEFLAESYGNVDSEGAELFKNAASQITAQCIVPPREAIHYPHLVPFEQTHMWERQQEEQRRKEEALKDYNHHVITYDDVKHIDKLYPSFDLEHSMSKRMSSKAESVKDTQQLPNILEVLEVVCYDEERYAVLSDSKTTFAKMGTGIHDTEGNIDTVVNTEGDYVYQTRGLVRNLYYRGQTIKHNLCYPSLYRGLSQKQQFIERVKLCEFSLLLHKHPSAEFFDKGMTNRLGNGKEEHHRMHIDDEALAQHYGIKTEYLDLTADKWVAAFFACCDYKNAPQGERDVYEKHDKADVGVFYVYQDEVDYSPEGGLRPIGMQPYTRPVLQAGYVQRLEEKQDFNTLATVIPFRFDSGCSSILYWLFNQSGHIQPSEVIEVKAKRIVKEDSCFSEQAYTMAHKRYFQDLNDDEFVEMVKGYGLKSQMDPLVDFTPEEMQRSIEDRKQIEPYLRFNTRAEQIFTMKVQA